MAFIRVRGATVGDPLHEFDVPVREVERHPELYEVIDPEPAAHQRPALFVSGVVKAPDAAPPDSPKPRAKKNTARAEKEATDG